MEPKTDKLVNAIIDRLMGYRYFTIAHQRLNQKIWDYDCGEYANNYAHYEVGSYSEAMPFAVRSDRDVMQNYPYFPVVLWKFEPPCCSHTGGYVVAEHQEDPAYLYLNEHKNWPLHECLKGTIIDNRYMSSDAFKDAFATSASKYVPVDTKIKGPTIQMSYSMDAPNLSELTLCLKCQSWPLVTDDFYTRDRSLTSWPSKKLMKKIHRLGCHVVGVGRHSSPLKEIEWRMSFSVAEKELCFEVLEPYAKVMFALKAIKKNYLGEMHCDSEEHHQTAFCSYFIKTACFWMCETVPHKDCGTMQLVRMTLDWLIECYKDEQLPHYFIPKQNLIRHLTTEQCKRIKTRLLHVKKDVWPVTMLSINQQTEHRLLKRILRREQNVTGDIEDYKKLHALYALFYSDNVYETQEEIELNEKFKSTSLFFGFFSYLVRRAFEDRCQYSWKRFIPGFGKFMIDLVKDIEKMLPEYGELFKHHLYFTAGDLCTALFITLPNQCSDDNGTPKPLDYYKLGGAIVHLDGWRDNLCIGTQAHTIRYYYLTGNYEQLQHTISITEPLITQVKQDSNLVNGLRKIYLNKRDELELNAWKIDESISQCIQNVKPTCTGSRVVGLFFNPIMFILYVMATLSLKEGDLDKASHTLNDMNECLKVIYHPEESGFSQLLIDIINMKMK